jgi:hypothetical protein
LAPRLGLGARTRPGRTASPKGSSLEEPPLTAGFPKKSFPKESNSPRASSPWEKKNGSVFTIDPAEIADGLLDVKALMAEERFIRRVLPVFGFTRLDAFAPCCLAGGTGDAHLTLSKRGQYLYCCPCHGNGRGRSVTDAYAAKISGRIKMRTGEVYFLWTVRLWAEIGAVCPIQPWLPPLPQDADESTIKVYEGLALFLGVRALTAFPSEFTYSRSFVMDWCQLSEDKARARIEALREAQIIVKVGVHHSGAYLYLVGEGV